MKICPTCQCGQDANNCYCECTCDIDEQTIDEQLLNFDFVDFAIYEATIIKN